MARKNKPSNVYIDATPLLTKRISGVGKVLLETVRAIDDINYTDRKHILFAPFNERGKLEMYRFKNISIRYIIFPHKIMSLFSRMKYSPPIDIFIGKGVYVFENYRNWNLLYSKSITYIHDVAFKKYPQFIEPANLKYMNKYMKLWLDRSDKLVTVSDSSRKEIVKEFGNEYDISIVPNASDESMYPRTQQEVNETIKKWNLPNKYHLYLGNIEPRKNLVNMLGGFELYLKQGNKKDALLLVGGDGWNNSEILRKIDELRRTGVEIIKPVKYVPDEDIPALISGATTVVQTSWHEGFGMSVIHAIACGTPVVASRIPALMEVTAGNEESVVFVDPSSAASIQEGIKTASAMPRPIVPQPPPSWHDSVDKLESVINDLY